MAWTVADRSGKPLSGGPYAGAEIITFSEEETGDQDKTLDFTTDVVGAAPNAGAAEVLFIRVEYVAAAGGSARVVRIDVLDSADDVVGGVGAVQNTAGGATKHMTYARLMDQTASGQTDHERLPKNLLFFPGMSLNWTASNSAAGDNMILHVQLAVYS